MADDKRRGEIEAVARALCYEGILTLSGRFATWERDADSFRGIAERVMASLDRVRDQQYEGHKA